MAADTRRMDEPPIAYMERTRDWYLALGYDNPYRWAHLPTMSRSAAREAARRARPSRW